ncbi:helix-turn-helix domain-containing protein [Haladaptatus salinisoli]|uniref:helix-turn-helix domain-containing protein n=1 Tax=Haladaptatus salinisoli TaxID=2884876 RepID=UPI001D0A544B|nr:helix-turn-helix domain-containing protein [Haladaptatus salinisoli]
MAHLRLKLNAAATEDWLATLSTEFPDTTFNVSATIPTDNGLLGIVEVRLPDGEGIVSDIKAISEVESCKLLHTDDQMVVFQFTSRMTKSYNALISSEIVPQYPVRLHDGWYSAQLTASQEHLSGYLDELSAVGIPYEIVSLTHSYHPNDVLTKRQWQVITEAVECGYYEASRRCTLAELAETFEINKSSMSKLLQRAEKRIVTEFVAEAST